MQTVLSVVFGRSVTAPTPLTTPNVNELFKEKQKHKINGKGENKNEKEDTSKLQRLKKDAVAHS